MLNEIRVGEIIAADGTVSPARADKTGAALVGDAHGRFAEAARRGRLFSTGMTTTSISNATFTTATLGATCTPVVGVWNPPTSTVNLEILQAVLEACITALQTTGPGPFMWCVASQQSAISTGLNPWNRRTMVQAGSQAKGFANTALTGLSGNLSIAVAAAVTGGGMPLATLQTAAGLMTYAQAQVENVDGAWIVPPGGVLALLCTTTPVAISAASMLLWEEVPIVSPG